MKKTLSIVLFVLLVFLAVACSPEHTHDYKLVPEKSLDATCTANGYNYMQCSCGAIQSIPTAVLGHDYVVDAERSSASTCIKKGNSYKVCSRCEDIKNVDLPLDPANHPFFYDKSSTSTPEYVGVYDKWKDVTTVPTCARDGEGVFTECTACGKTGEFKVTVSSSEFIKYLTTSADQGGAGWECSHVKVNAKGDNVEKLTADDIKEWKTNTPATAFVEGNETAYCPTCNKLIEDEETKNTLVERIVPIKKDNVVGFWTVKTAAADAAKNYDIYYLTISKKNGSYNLDGYKMSVNDYGVYSTDSETITGGTWSTEAVGTDVLNKGSYTLTLTSSSNAGGLGSSVTFVLTEAGKDGKDVLENTVKNGDALLSIAGSFYKLENAAEHTHALTLMSDARAVSGDTSGDRGHYLECEECGLKYVYERHSSNCEVCGWTDAWYAVLIGEKNTDYATLPNVTYEVYFVEKTPKIKMTENGTYTYFDGRQTKNFTSVTPGTAAFNFSSEKSSLAAGSRESADHEFTTTNEVLEIIFN